ncbi:hypothetical protein MHYP_G00304620 [Metynnis hypsauchen]
MMEGKTTVEETTHHSTVETRSVARASSSKSLSSKSSASRAIAAAYAKVEAARARAEFAKKESDILIEKARIEARLNTLRHEREVVAALAEASVLEKAEEAEVVDDKSLMQEVEERTHSALLSSPLKLIPLKCPNFLDQHRNPPRLYLITHLHGNLRLVQEGSHLSKAFHNSQ